MRKAGIKHHIWRFCGYSLLLILSACLPNIQQVAIDESPIRQKILFEVTYLNGWGWNANKGIFIDNEGNIFSFDNSHIDWKPAWQRKDNARIPEVELTQKYSNVKQMAGSIEAETLQEKYNQIILVEQEQISTRKRTGCYDYGQLSYKAYAFEAETNEYIPILLYEAGDSQQENLSDQGQQLAEWLITLANSLDLVEMDIRLGAVVNECFYPREDL